MEVELDPYAVRAGRDPQLEKAVELVMEQLKKNPPKEVKKPEYPNYHKKDGKGAGGGGQSRKGEPGGVSLRVKSKTNWGRP